MTKHIHPRRVLVLARYTAVVLFGSALPCVPVRAVAAKAAPKAAQDPAVPAMTVEELVHHLSQALATGAWESAVGYGKALLRDYGDRPEIVRLRERVQLTLLRCHLHLGQWAEAAPLFEVALQTLSSAPPLARGELLFQKAACELRLEQNAAASKSIAASLLLLPPTSPLRTEAVLLQAACFMASGTPMKAGELLEAALPVLDRFQAERAIPLGMRAFLEAKQPKRAHGLLEDGGRRFSGLEEESGLQSLLLQAGSDLLDQGRPGDALACLKQISPPQRLILVQQQRLSTIEKAIATHEAQPAASLPARAGLRGAAAQIRTQLDSLGSGNAFAAATRIQMAAAYQALQRPHEAALVLEDAVRQLPPAELLEHACLELAKTWLQLERWEKVIAAAAPFASAYPASKHLALMLYLRGCAEQKAGLFSEALRSFSSLSLEFKTHELSASARFMQPFTLLLDNRPAEAAQGFAAFLQSHKKHDLAEAAAYWLCVAQTQCGTPASVRTAASAYLAGYPNGENRPAVLLRRAQAMSALRERAPAVADLEKLLSEAPVHSCSGEAALLLGDCLLAQGNVEGALAAWDRVPPNQREAREEALFKCAKTLHRDGRTREVRELLRAFDSAHTDSARLAEAAHWLRKACAQEGHPEETTAWILEHVALYGNNPAATGIEPLLRAGALQSGSEDGRESWCAQLQQLAGAAEEGDQETLLSRLKWALAKEWSKRDKDAARGLLIEAATLTQALLTSSEVLADGAGAMEEECMTTEALRLWRELLRWHPRAPQRDRALYSLARLDFDGQRYESAWESVRRFEKGPSGSPLLPRLLLVKAKLLQRESKPGDALGCLEQIVRAKGAGAAAKCEALFSMGELHRASGAPQLALPYLQRVYVSYGGFQPWAAKAYLASAEAFTALGKPDAARKTYLELLASTLVPEAPERAVAASKLESLGGRP